MKLLILVMTFLILDCPSFAKDKKKKEKTSAETIAELQEQLEELEKAQTYEKYQKEIATFSASKKMRSKMILLAMSTKTHKFPKAPERLPYIEKMVSFYQSFVDNKVPASKRKAIERALIARLIKEQNLDRKSVLLLSKYLRKYLVESVPYEKLNRIFPFLAQGATLTHAKIISSKGKGRASALKILEAGKSDKLAELTYKKEEKGYWTFTDEEKLEYKALSSGKSEAEAKILAEKKASVNRHCENYTGKSVICEGVLFIRADSKKMNPDKKSRSLSGSK